MTAPIRVSDPPLAEDLMMYLSERGYVTFRKGPHDFGASMPVGAVDAEALRAKVDAELAKWRDEHPGANAEIVE